jgi:hypothetical protein
MSTCIDAVGSSNLLDLVFTNFSDYDITFPDSGIIKPDTYHPPVCGRVVRSVAQQTETKTLCKLFLCKDLCKWCFNRSATGS